MKTELFKKAVEEAGTLQAKWVDQSFKAMDDANVLMKAGFKYWSDLQADAQKHLLNLVP